MRIGISALTSQIEEAINISKKNKQVNHIEIGIDNIEECKVVKKYLDEINKYNLSIGIHLPMELNTCENIKYISNSWIDFVKKINDELNHIDIKYFNMHLGYAITSRYNKKMKAYLDNSIEFIDNLGKSIDCNLIIENTYSKNGDISNIGTSAEEFEYILNNINISNIKFCYDTGHNLINYDNFLERLKNNITLVHLSDNDGVTDMHIGLGKGKLELDDIENILKLRPEILILEVNYSDLEDSLEVLNQFI